MSSQLPESAKKPLRPREPEDHLSRIVSKWNIGLDTEPRLSIDLDEKLREGIAAQLRALADLLDPPKES